MSWYVWLGLVGLIVSTTVAVCIALAILWLALDALCEPWAEWRTRRALARDGRGSGAPPGV